MSGASAADVLTRLGDKWKGLIERAADLERTGKAEPFRDRPRPGLVPDGERNHPEAGDLLNRLLRTYRGATLAEVFPGREVGLDGSTCYCIDSTSPMDLHMIGRDTARERLLADLRLLYGIGGRTQASLKEQGWATIGDLLRHPRHNGEAARFLAILETGDVGRLIEWIRRWLPASDPLAFYCSSFHPPGAMVVLDIETLGLSPDRPVILIGAARPAGDDIVVRQYLVRDIGEEAAVVKTFLSQVHSGSFLVTYNGKSFDVPYVRGRMAYYGIRGRLDVPHYDMLPFARRVWREQVADCRLVTLEKHLFATAREDDVPGDLVPAFYKTYQETGNVGPLVPIVAHNRQDLVTLARLFARLHEEWR